ncbi:aminodeoxychorismate lyase [Thalassomonas viridans]|uniref:Aminodeoxychorismate lyase n=1 Tax=Thalassomonas viridans TaxID=137584 RepID=A0AAE9Z7M5_9GAMM|nr:aminodeoxychorismate lyase [Thalassomonas viridans]WDE07629.1 aminodeoxychorismate lyase [Thalassomonas viridans]
MLYCQVNGQQTDVLSVNDRGFAYGDGIFTTGKISNGRLELCPRHIARLQLGCSKLQISPPDWLMLNDDIGRISARYPLAVLKIIITAGQGGRGYSRVGTGESCVIIQVHDYPEHYQAWSREGIMLGICGQKLGLNPMLSGIKHLNRLEQVFIRQELDRRSEDDLLVLNIRNEIVETSCSNVFWQADGAWFTPVLDDSGVEGLARASILASRKDVDCVRATLPDLENLDAMFICNAVMGAVPVRAFDGRDLDIAPVSDFKSCFS